MEIRERACVPWQFWSRSFNGATSSQTWKLEDLHRGSHPLQSRELQWSHVFSDMEIFKRHGGQLCWNIKASMEPRLLRHGNRLYDGRSSFDPKRASMEPRLLRHGNLFNTCTRSDALQGFNGATSSQTWKLGSKKIYNLRWKEGFNGATSSQTWKSQTTLYVGIEASGASMEPRLLRHGNGGERHGRISSYNSCASMEPRLLRHGNQKTEYYSERVAANALQWSHVFSDMEIRVLGRKAAGAGVGGFNGATSSQTWK